MSVESLTQSIKQLDISNCDISNCDISRVNSLLSLPNSTLSEILDEADLLFKTIIEAQKQNLTKTMFDGKISAENETILQNKGYSVTIFNQKNIVRGPFLCTCVEWNLTKNS